MQIVAYKLLLAVLCLAVVLAVLGSLRFCPITAWTRFGRVELFAFWFASRLLPWLGIYFVAGFAPQSDLATAFFPQALGAAHGQVPYRDFESFFSPLFPFLIAPPMLIWPDARLLVPWLSLFEAATILLTARHAGLAAPSPDRTRFYTCAFLAPAPLLFSVIGAQEDFLLWLVMLGVWSALIANSSTRAGLVVLLGLLGTKPLFLLGAAATLGATRRRLPFLFVVAPLSALTLAVLWFLTGKAFLMTVGQSENISPPNLWLWLHWLTNGLVPAGGRAISFGVLLGLLTLAVAGGAWWSTRTHRTFASFAAGWTILCAALLFFSPKSLVAYFGYFALPSLFLALKHRGALAVWLGFGALAVVESSLWYRLGSPMPRGLTSIPTPLVGLELALQTALLAGTVAIALHAYRILRQDVTVTSRPAPPSAHA